MKRQPRILVAFGASGHFLSPESGPIISLRELMSALQDEFSFTVLARPYLDLPNRAEVSGLNGLRRWLCEAEYDIIYLNSFFDREYTVPILSFRRANIIPRRPVILSPRGEFTRGALGQKPTRKRAYISLARRLGLLADAWLHATGPDEERDIRRTFPYARGICLAPNLRVLRPLPEPREVADGGRTRIVFLSRIDRMKNLDYALGVLPTVRNPVLFDIYGPVTHQDYWETCQQLISRLPPHIEVRYLGAIPNDEVMRTLAAYDIFFLPTLGENFGHAIFDALEAGTPVLISDRTPWADLEKADAGWSLPLGEPAAFASAIEGWAAMSPDTRARLRAGARQRAESYVNQKQLVDCHRQMFWNAMSAGGDAPSVSSPKVSGR